MKATALKTYPLSSASVTCDKRNKFGYYTTAAVTESFKAKFPDEQLRSTSETRHKETVRLVKWLKKVGLVPEEWELPECNKKVIKEVSRLRKMISTTFLYGAGFQRIYHLYRLDPEYCHAEILHRALDQL